MTLHIFCLGEYFGISFKHFFPFSIVPFPSIKKAYFYSFDTISHKRISLLLILSPLEATILFHWKKEETKKRIKSKKYYFRWDDRETDKWRGRRVFSCGAVKESLIRGGGRAGKAKGRNVRLCRRCLFSRNFSKSFVHRGGLSRVHSVTYVPRLPMCEPSSSGTWHTWKQCFSRVHREKENLINSKFFQSNWIQQ